MKHRTTANLEPSRRGGFALLELIIGTALIATVLGAVVAQTVRQSELRRVDSELNLAFIACRSNLEAVRSMTVAQVEALDKTGFDVIDLNGNAGALHAVPGDADGLPGEFEVTVDKSSGTAKLLRVVARVRWYGVARPQTFQITTYIGDRK